MLPFTTAELVRYASPLFDCDEVPNPWYYFTMSFKIENFRNEISALCEHLAVARLDLFGSANTEEFTEDSDLDFLVAFKPNQPNLLDRFLSLKERLQELFNKRIDLITERSIRNPFLRDSIERTRKNVFASQA